MKSRNLLLSLAAVLVWLSCATPGGDREPAADADFPDSWHDVMEEVIAPGYDEVLAMESDKEPRDMDLPAVEKTATHMAKAMALGYAALQIEEVPDFDKLAARSEKWLLQIAEAARTGDGAAAKRMIIDGQFENCEDCHDAADRVGIGQ